MKYLKYFETEAEYASYKNGSDYVLPNVSFIEELSQLPDSDPRKSVMYNPNAASASPNVVCTYNVTDISQETKILDPYGLGYITNMIVNGVEMEAETYYQFDTVGNHVVEFVLDDPTTIGDRGTFMGCSGLTSVIIPNSVTSIGYNAFYNCNNLTSIVIPDSVISIDGSTFYRCSNLISITIPDSVTSIGRSAFQYCYSLNSITIPDSVISIDGSTFRGCSGLTSIVIPDSVTSIGHYAFYECSSLSEITCNAITAPSISSDVFQNIKSGGILKVPAGSDYSSWMSTDSYYLGYYNWTVEYIYDNNYVNPIICTYNVTDISRETKILHDYALGVFSSMIVDGVEMDVDCYYQFDTTGLHTVEFIYAAGVYGDSYKLNEVVGEGWFRLWDDAWISLEIPASVKVFNGNESICGDNLKEIIFHSIECPISDSYAGNWMYEHIFVIAETGVLKYPKGSDYSLVIEHMAKYHPGWTIKEF